MANPKLRKKAKTASQDSHPLGNNLSEGAINDAQGYRGQIMTRNAAIEFPASNVTKVWIGNKTVLFSYEEPVALWVRGDGELKRYALKEAPTQTTAKHLNQHGPKRFLMDGDHYEEVTAEELDSLIG